MENNNSLVYFGFLSFHNITFLKIHENKIIGIKKVLLTFNWSATSTIDKLAFQQTLIDD